MTDRHPHDPHGSPTLRDFLHDLAAALAAASCIVSIIIWGSYLSF